MAPIDDGPKPEVLGQIIPESIKSGEGTEQTKYSEWPRDDQGFRSRIAELESFECSGDERADLVRLLQLTGQAKRAGLIQEETNLDYIDVIALIREARVKFLHERDTDIGQTSRASFRRQGDFFSQIPRAEIAAVDRMTATYHAKPPFGPPDPRFLAARHEGLTILHNMTGSASTREQRPSNETQRLAYQISEVARGIDGGQREILNLELEYDMIMDEFRSLTSYFKENAPPEFVDAEFLQTEEKIEQIYDQFKADLARQFMSYEREKNEIINKSKTLTPNERTLAEYEQAIQRIKESLATFLEAIRKQTTSFRAYVEQLDSDLKA